MTVKHTLVSSDMRVFALCSLMEIHRAEWTAINNSTVPSYPNEDYFSYWIRTADNRYFYNGAVGSLTGTSMSVPL